LSRVTRDGASGAKLTRCGDRPRAPLLRHGPPARARATGTCAWGASAPTVALAPTGAEEKHSSSGRFGFPSLPRPR
jgi:hypothetical protein